MKTRLEICLKLFNWQGGTIHQCNQELSKVINKLNEFTHYKIDILNMSDFDFSMFLIIYEHSICQK